jgi:hypothetical protein
MPEIRRPRLNSVAYQTIQHEFAALPPQNKQNLVNYHPLLRLFAVQLTSWAGFLWVRVALRAAGLRQDYSG